MTLSERQEKVLSGVIREYIRQAEPISSEYLRRKYRMDLSSATIRNEMQKLTDLGYLCQPHTSAGRAPTDKGYRYLVDSLAEKEIDNLIDETFDQAIEKIKEAEDCLAFTQEASKILSSFSSGLIFSYIPEGGFCLREGWMHVFKDPEFSDIGYVRSFLSMIDFFEKNIDEFQIDDFSIKVYIGGEVPMPKSKDFSIVASKCFFKDQETILAILGPKRMPYGKNIPLINALIKNLK